ncbi:chondroitin AC/alginate lyase [Amylocystis lapponica]|nr:chondroitin AC/alginate lyase [Amylocystis lapponica]
MFRFLVDSMLVSSGYSFCQLFLLVAILLGSLRLGTCVTSYANDFVDPRYVLSRTFSPNTVEAQKTIVLWADQLAAKGPWSVMNKPITPPSGNKHDYMSWSPYSWPECSTNETEITPEEVWTMCPFVTKDGLFNPDARLVNDVGSFSAMADAVLYNSLAWVLDGSSRYSENAVLFLRTWFLDTNTAMAPHLNYAQMKRGPDGQNGSHTGVLDLKCMTKIASGVLVLRLGNASIWTPDLDRRLIRWAREYIGWLQESPIAILESEAVNNHGSFYYNQLAALQILVGDNIGARQTIMRYFDTLFVNQTAANGDQPLESARTRPYHYRAYNLAAMITNAKLGSYLGCDVWNNTSGSGATVQTALDYAMTLPAGNETASELYPSIVAVASIYGDPHGKYASFMEQVDPGRVMRDSHFFWNQPFSYRRSEESTLTVVFLRPSREPMGNANSYGSPWILWVVAYLAATIFVANLVFVRRCARGRQDTLINVDLQ